MACCFPRNHVPKCIVGLVVLEALAELNPEVVLWIVNRIFMTYVIIIFFCFFRFVTIFFLTVFITEHSKGAVKESSWSLYYRRSIFQHFPYTT